MSTLPCRRYKQIGLWLLELMWLSSTSLQVIYLFIYFLSPHSVPPLPAAALALGRKRALLSSAVRQVPLQPITSAEPRFEPIADVWLRWYPDALEIRKWPAVQNRSDRLRRCPPAPGGIRRQLCEAQVFSFLWHFPSWKQPGGVWEWANFNVFGYSVIRLMRIVSF